MKIIVTGGAGFIGSALCRHVVSDLGWQVVVIDKLTYAGVLSSLHAVANDLRLTFVHGDICDRGLLDDLFTRYHPDAIMHLAAESHVDRSITHSLDFLETNVKGTFTLLEAARTYLDSRDAAERGRFRFLHVSTDEVYGSLEGGDPLFCETTPYAPRSPYSASKAASDHLVHAWGHTYGIPVLISHCSNNYGPFQLPEKLIPLTILNALHGQVLPIYGDGLNVRDWLHVDDHVRALILILERGRVGETYNVGGRNEHTNIDVVHAICDCLDRHAKKPMPHRDLIKFVTDRPGHDRRYAIDARKLENELGWCARETFSTGLEKTVQWYLGNSAWWEPLRAAGHGQRRLGISEAEEKG